MCWEQTQHAVWAWEHRGACLREEASDCRPVDEVAWAPNEFVCMQCIRLIMRTCLREIEDGERALWAFDFLMRQANGDLCHHDAEKLMRVLQDLSLKFQASVQEQSPKLAEKLANNIDFFPMLVQNWLVDHSPMFCLRLPATAAARLWDHSFQRPNAPICFPAPSVQPAESLLCHVEEIDEPSWTYRRQKSRQQWGYSPRTAGIWYFPLATTDATSQWIRRRVAWKHYASWKGDSETRCQNAQALAALEVWQLRAMASDEVYLVPQSSAVTAFTISRAERVVSAHVVPMDEANWPPAVRQFEQFEQLPVKFWNSAVHRSSIAQCGKDEPMFACGVGKKHGFQGWTNTYIRRTLIFFTGFFKRAPFEFCWALFSAAPEATRFGPGTTATFFTGLVRTVMPVILKLWCLVCQLQGNALWIWATHKLF